MPCEISGIAVRGFKAFDGFYAFPLRPLTLLYGQNSAGKSSLIHALLLMRHIEATGQVDVREPLLGGRAVDLGGFHSYVHGHDDKRIVQLGLTFSIVPGDDTLTQPEVVGDGRLLLSIGQVRYPADLDIAPPNGFELRGPGVPSWPQIVAVEFEWSSQTDTSSARDLICRWFRQPTGSGFMTDSKWVESRKLGLQREGSGELLDEAAQVRFAVERFVPRITDYGTPPTSRFARMYELISAAAREFLSDVRYLGPLRAYPERNFAATSRAPGQSNGDGLDQWRDLAENTDLRERVNSWLTPNTGYKLLSREWWREETVRRVVERALREIHSAAHREDGGEVEDAIAQGIVQFLAADGDETDTARRAAVDVLLAAQRPKEGDIILDVHLRDKGAGEVSHRDIGVGISQVIPVLAMAVANASATAPLLIEQPELHLHPNLQGRLADVFLEESVRSQNASFLIETHSALLLHRILRRFREAPDLDRSRVLVLAIGRFGGADAAGPVDVRPLQVTNEADFFNDFPDGFFLEEANELGIL